MRRLTGAGSHGDDGRTPAQEQVDIRALYRSKLQEGIGGWQGMVVAALPPLVFVLVNATAALRPAIISAIAAGVALTAYRIIRKQSTQQALSGLLGVAIAALIAARTGEARGYFLLGIWQSFLYAVPFAVSVLVRRPLVGVLWEFLDPTPGGEGRPWHRRRGLLGAYTVASVIATAMFLSRGIVQATLYERDSTGWLAFARISMGYPLFIAAVAASWWVVRRARMRVSPDPSVSAVAVDGSADDGATQGGLGLGKGEK